MNDNNIKKYVNSILDKLNISKKDFYIASSSKSKKIEYKFSNRLIKEKYIIRYFENYDALVLWNRSEHVSTTKVMTLCNRALHDFLKNNINYDNKGVEYKWWKQSKTYICHPSEIESILKNIFGRNENEK